MARAKSESSSSPNNGMRDDQEYYPLTRDNKYTAQHLGILEIFNCGIV
jgi:hypothetical protein